MPVVLLPELDDAGAAFAALAPAALGFADLTTLLLGAILLDDICP